jgi:hypothetical protein
MVIKIIKLLGVLLLIAVAFIYGRFYVSKAARDRAAVKNVNAQHAAADIEGDQLFRSRIDRLSQLGILGEKVAESKADTCYIDPEGGGFSIEKWVQRCQLDYVAGYTALLSRDETFARLQTASLHEEDPSFPRLRTNRRGCRYSSWPSNSVSYVPAGSVPDSDDCRIPELVNGVGPRGAGSPGSTSFDYTFDPNAIDQTADLLWITFTHSYYQEDLECRPGLTCFDPPRSTPIQAD